MGYNLEGHGNSLRRFEARRSISKHDFRADSTQRIGGYSREVVPLLQRPVLLGKMAAV